MTINYNKVAVVILAAGKGTRMNSSLPKVLHKLAEKPILIYPLELILNLSVGRIVIVIGYQAEQVRKALIEVEKYCHFVIQEPQLGTGHAVTLATQALIDWEGPILILCGDVPLIKKITLHRLLDTHIRNGNILTVLSVKLNTTNYYGRLIIEGEKLKRIVEYRDANESEKKITLVNTGIYVIEAKELIQQLALLTTNNVQKEYYLTELVEIMNNANLKVSYTICQNSLEVTGINSKKELEFLSSCYINKLI